MTVEQVDKIVAERPFKPFRITLESGEQVTVQQPRKALMSGPYVAVVGLYQQTPTSAGREKLRIVRAEQIVSAEFVDADHM